MDSILVCVSECISNVTQSKYDQLIIYPNPANKVINIDLQGFPNERYSIEILNFYGNIVFQEERFKTENYSIIHLENSGLKPGIYYLKIQSNKNKYLNKLLIQN